jgi:osmotically-inducible protein OsmY
MNKLRTLGIGALLGSAAAYVISRSESSGRALGGRVYGMRPRRHGDVDDVTLTHTVESELFGSGEVPKGNIVVNSANGVVQLRGEVDSNELIDDLVARTRRVGGVKDVESLLHVPGTDAPMHQ